LILRERPFLYLGPNEPIAPQDPQDPRWQTWLALREQGTPLSEIFRTTSLRCGTSRRNNQEVEVSGVFLRAVRFNSSCRPNVHAHWNQTHRYMEFRALRNIAINEELCVCYNPRVLVFPTAARQQSLHDDFGFVCNCNCCEYPSIPSDDRRDALREVVDAVDAIPFQDRIERVSSSLQIKTAKHSKTRC
jgi:SET domain